MTTAETARHARPWGRPDVESVLDARGRSGVNHTSAQTREPEHAELGWCVEATIA